MNCPKCGKEVIQTKQDKAARQLTSALSRMFPDLKKAMDESKDFCNECWKNTVKPLAKGIYGELEKE